MVSHSLNFIANLKENHFCKKIKPKLNLIVYYSKTNNKMLIVLRNFIWKQIQKLSSFGIAKQLHHL